MHRILIFTWPVLLACFLLLTACDNRELKHSNRLDRSLAGEPQTLDPHTNSSVQGHRVLMDLYEGLLRYSPNGSLENALAESWSVSPDGLEYEFILRADGRWSNGDPVTAHDFEYSLKRLVDPANAAFYSAFLVSLQNASEIMAGEVEPSLLGVDALDDHTLQFHLSEPTPYFPQLLTHPATYPLHQSSIDASQGKFGQPGLVATNGAYTLEEHVLSSYLRLKKNPYYRDASSVSIDEVAYHVLVDAQAAYNRYRSGELDITSTVPTGAFAQIVENYPDQLKVAPQLGIYYYAYNMTKAPFGDNHKLRMALSMVVDREALVSLVTGRGEVAAFSFVPPGIEGYVSPQPEYANWSMDKRIQRAKELYREAGFSDDNPATFELRYNVGNSENTIAVALQAMWNQALGAKAELVNEEFKVLLSNIREMKVTEMYRLSWVGDYFDPHTFLQLFQSDNPSNLTGFSDPRYDELMKAASVELDPERRMAVFLEAESLMLDAQPLIPLYYYVSKHLVNPRVRGWVDTTVDFHPTQFLSLATE